MARADSLQEINLILKTNAGLIIQPGIFYFQRQQRDHYFRSSRCESAQIFFVI
jgi:hypothetical protein